MRGLAKSGAEEAMEMEFGKTGLTRRLLQAYAGLIFVSQQVTSATEPAEGVVMKKLRHDRIILPGAMKVSPSRLLLKQRTITE